ncbi:MAG: hypothetical protein IAE78_17535 [Myxococcus sp.]|nr:hypothetical protein [Myxococcus sp.]
MLLPPIGQWRSQYTVLTAPGTRDNLALVIDTSRVQEVRVDAVPMTSFTAVGTTRPQPARRRPPRGRASEARLAARAHAAQTHRPGGTRPDGKDAPPTAAFAAEPASELRSPPRRTEGASEKDIRPRSGSSWRRLRTR